MPLLEAAGNIARSLRFQWSLGGSRASRLSYAARYWGAYVRHRRADPSAGTSAAHAKAMESLGAASLELVDVVLPDGLKLRVDRFTAFIILRELYDEKVYEHPSAGDFPPRPGETVFDLGAQQGCYATYAARRVGPSGSVVAIEPEPRNFSLLKANLEGNQLSNARALPLAVSDRPGDAVLHINAANPGGHSLSSGHFSGPKETVSVKAAELDELAREIGADPDLIKIDIESSGLAALKSGRELLKRKKPRLILELDNADEIEAAVALLGGLDYQVIPRRQYLFARPS